MADLQITVDDRELSARWTGDNPETRTALEDALPLSGDASRWGDELYFSVPVDVDPTDTRTAVPQGAVAYWPAGNALCLFWGPTPASESDEPRAASGVAVVAEITDTSPIAGLDGDARVRLDRD